MSGIQNHAIHLLGITKKIFNNQRGYSKIKLKINTNILLIEFYLILFKS